MELWITSNRIEKISNIQNIVSTAELNYKLILKEIALQAINVKYNPKKYTGLTMKKKRAKTNSSYFFKWKNGLSW